MDYEVGDIPTEWEGKFVFLVVSSGRQIVYTKLTEADIIRYLFFLQKR